MHSFHGASIIERKPAAFAKSTAETAMDKVSNILRPLVSTDLDLQAYKFHRLPYNYYLSNTVLKTAVQEVDFYYILLQTK